MMKKIILILSLFAFQDLAAQTDSVYLFAYFKSNGQDGLHLAYSNDGLNYTALKGDSAFIKPVIGPDKLMRDPCIIRGGDGQFHMVWTIGWTGKGIGYASSKDLIHWSEQQYLPVMEKEDAMNCWAPEITYDARHKEYAIYWATTIRGKYKTDTTVEKGYNHRIYYVTTKDFKKYAKTRTLYNRGFNVIDATIVPVGKRWVMFLKDETLKPTPQKNIRIATARRLTGRYSKPSSAITGDYWAEGPTAIQTGKGWIVYFDKYRSHQYGAIQSIDLKNWTDISDKIVMPKGMRHGSVLKLTKQALKNIEQGTNE